MHNIPFVVFMEIQLQFIYFWQIQTPIFGPNHLLFISPKSKSFSKLTCSLFHIFFFFVVFKFKPNFLSMHDFCFWYTKTFSFSPPHFSQIERQFIKICTSVYWLLKCSFGWVTFKMSRIYYAALQQPFYIAHSYAQSVGLSWKVSVCFLYLSVGCIVLCMCFDFLALLIIQILSCICLLVPFVCLSLLLFAVHFEWHHCHRKPKKKNHFRFLLLNWMLLCVFLHHFFLSLFVVHTLKSNEKSVRNEHIHNKQ